MTNLKRAQLLRRRVDRLGRGLSIWIVAALGLPLAILVAAISSPAQAPGKVPRIGYLWIGAEGSDRATSLPGFQQGLRELGYEEGVNVAIAYRYAGGSMERLRELVSDMIGSKVDVIVAAGVIVADTVKQATTTIPVVAIAGDPVASGLVPNLPRPGGNITGFSFVVTEFGGKWVELLRELAPHGTRIAMLWNPLNAASRELVEAVREACGNLGLTLLSDEARRPADLPVAFAAITEQAPDALIIDTDVVLLSNRKSIVEFAAAHDFPAMYGLREFVDDGGLISYGPVAFDVWRRVAGYVDKILKGAKPADLPVQQPTTFELVVNLKTAKSLGLTVPQSILARADEVIE
jgi:putative tryptophan/tyrosine transport system substrate-binding protein